MSTKSKSVSFSLSVDEYTAINSPESWTSPLKNQPPTPGPAQDAPFRAASGLQMHPALSPAHALKLDFSFPSDAFRRNPQLTGLLDVPACHPPRDVIVVRIKKGVFKERVEVKHTPSGRAVTVGDVLTAVQNRLRQRDPDAPIETRPYMRRRIETVNGYRAGPRDRRAEAQTVAAEAASAARLVDRLLGHTLFKGLQPRSGEPDSYWEINLDKPRRYE
ncbi:hypothetical protein C8R43DRAFT_991701 [Mycena crocata]|nr:hypothetical protein C8R43DRAFT_991701 [Mycena crocata]